MKRPSKYGAVRTEVDGIKFASKAEARRYSELKLLERAGEICELHLQPRFPLRINGQLVTTYVADFVYVVKGEKPELTGTIVEDVKGVRTEVFKIKAKLFEAIHGFPVREV